MGINVNSQIRNMIGILVMIILLWTWFFPTVNGASGMNNTTTLWLGGTNYTWYAGIISIFVLVIFLLVVWDSKGK